MEIDARYRDQVALLVRILPIVAGESCFALKGGTAINLFYRQLPRLSVDIDLVYLPLEAWDMSLRSIDEALDRLSVAIQARVPETKCMRTPGGGNQQTRIVVRMGGSNVKIEVNPVIRGAVLKPALKPVCKAVEDELGFAEMNVLAFEEVYAGKMVAALDRQHPRDLFDILHLKRCEGITEALFAVFLVYVAASGRPMHELLDPNLSPLQDLYDREFAGMPRSPVGIEELEAARTWLIGAVNQRLGDHRVAAFLASLSRGGAGLRSCGPWQCS